MKKKFNLSFFHLILVVLVAAGLGYIIGTTKISASWENFRPIASIQNKAAPNSQNLDMRLFYDVLEKVNNEYFDKSKLDSQKVLYGAISGMLQSLEDPFTSFFPPKENEAFKTQLAGEFSGIGAELGLNKDKQIMIIAPLDGSPAQKAGIKAGDLIIKVDGEDTYGWTVAQAVEKIRGPKGTPIKLSLVHEGADKPTDVSVTRDTIVLNSVTSWYKKFSCSGDSCREDANCSNCTSIAYIRLSQFGDKTNDEWVKAVNELYPKISSDKNFKGVVLDLRNNPGGYLQDAVFIASEFVKSGTIVTQVDGDGKELNMDVTRSGVLTDVPVIVLINKGSASASEIVAGALRDYNRAELLGETSFGKGTIQTAVDIEGGGSVHLSIAKWITPKDTWVHEKGLEPDIKVEFDESKTANGLDNQLQAAIRELSK